MMSLLCLSVPRVGRWGGRAPGTQQLACSGQRPAALLARSSLGTSGTAASRFLHSFCGPQPSLTAHVVLPASLEFLFRSGHKAAACSMAALSFPSSGADQPGSWAPTFLDGSIAVSQQSFTAMHGPVASAPNMACLQGAGVRCSSSSGGAENMYLQPQQLQHQQGVAVAGSSGLPPTGAGLCPGPGPTDEQLMLELTLALAAQPGGPVVADSAQGKLQLLGQLQAVVAAQQQQLQQQLHSRQATTAAVACANLAAAGPVGLAARLSAPGCLAAQDDTMWGQRDDRPVADQCRNTFRASAGGYFETVYSGGFPGGLLPLQLQQQQQEVLSPCAFNNTPTALATLPPSLLAEVVGVDAAASIIGQASSSMACRVSSGSGSNGGCLNSSSTATPTCVDALGMGVRNICSKQPWLLAPGLTTAPGVAEVPDHTLQQQLHQAIEHLAGLQVSSNAAAGSAGPLSGPLSGNNKGCWDWASVEDLLRSDSTASKGSSGINRSSSGIPSENSVSSNAVAWGDAGCGHVGGVLPSSASNMTVCTSGGVLLGQGSGLGPGVGVVLQRTASTASCTSGLSGAGAPAARSSCSGAAPNSTRALPPAALGSVEPGVSPAGSAGQSAKQRPQGAASVDSLLRNCAPKWAKAGWNPKASVAASPATKGTGAFVRLSSTGSGDAGAEQKSAVCSSNGTGAFIPPAVRAAVAAAAAGLGPGSTTAGTSC